MYHVFVEQLCNWRQFMSNCLLRFRQVNSVWLRDDRHDARNAFTWRHVAGMSRCRNGGTTRTNFLARAVVRGFRGLKMSSEEIWRNVCAHSFRFPWTRFLTFSQSRRPIDFWLRPYCRQYLDDMLCTVSVLQQQFEVALFLTQVLTDSFEQKVNGKWEWQINTSLYFVTQQIITQLTD